MTTSIAVITPHIPGFEEGLAYSIDLKFPPPSFPGIVSVPG